MPECDITFGHFESHKRIELRFPHATKLLWKTLASTTRRYLGNPEILAVLVEQKPDDAEDWTCAQAAMDRLATVPKPYISVREADNCLCFLASTCLFLKRNGTERKQIEAFLVLMAKITPCELEPLSPRPGNEWGKADRVVECYDHICKVVGASPSWISIYQVHSWWRQLTKYRGNSPDIIRLARRLGELCEPVRSVFGKTEI